MLRKNDYWYAVSVPYTFQPVILMKVNKMFLNSDDLSNISKEFPYRNDKREGERSRLFSLLVGKILIGTYDK